MLSLFWECESLGKGVYRYVVDNSPSTPSGPPQSGSIIQCLAAHERAIPALNTYTLAGFPFSLPIVLKRFRNDGSKINNSVSFPTELFLDVCSLHTPPIPFLAHTHTALDDDFPFLWGATL